MTLLKTNMKDIIDFLLRTLQAHEEVTRVSSYSIAMSSALIMILRHIKIVEIVLKRKFRIEVDVKDGNISVESALSELAISSTLLLIKKLTKLSKTNFSQEEKSTSISVVSLLAIKRSKNNLISLMVLLFTLIIHEIVIYFSDDVLVNIPLMLLVVLIVAIAIEEYILSYRVKKGYFGTNTEEAKEIINFMLKNAQNNDQFNGPDGKIRIFDEILNSNVESEKKYNTGFNPSLG